MRKRPISEKEFQSQVIAFARLHGWRVAHFRPARTRHGWRTPVAGYGAGWPDAVLVRGRSILFRELKNEKGQLSREQRDWLAALVAAGCDARTWRPRDWPNIEATLKRG